MKFGLQMHPSHPPERDIRAGVEWDLQVLRWADEYGFSEAWIGEHFTIGWQTNPCPEILIAQSLRETKQITLAPGAHLLPYHNPIALAHRIAFIDHLAQGRYLLGIGAGAHASDMQMFATDGKNHAMTIEALDIMTRVWQTNGPFKFNGQFWNVDYPGRDPITCGPYLKPFQKPHPPIAMAGISPRSESVRSAGERGFIPLSVNLSPAYLAGHWEVYLEGASKAGRQVSRKDWRVGREFFVADTDEEAYRQAVGPNMGRAVREFLFPLFTKGDMMKHLRPNESIAVADITPEFMAKHVWLVGSPDTVEKKLRAQYAEAGGFGVMMGVAYDHSADPEPFRRSLELMGREVARRVQDLSGE